MIKMGLRDKLLEKWYKFTTQFKTQTEKRVQPSQVERAEDGLDHDRSMAKGRLKDEERQRKMLEEGKENDKKQKVGQYLQSRQEKLSKENLEDAISLRNFFTQLNQGNVEVQLTNQSRNEDFGDLQDILIDPKGMMYIVNEDGEVKMGGSNWGDIVQSPSGMITDIMAGYLPLNLSDEGMYMPSSETAQVPDIVMTEEEGLVFTENHTEKYKNKVARLKQQIQSQSQELGMMEKAMTGMAQQVKELQREKETLQVVAESEQEGREKHMEMAQNAIQQYNQQEIELNKTDSVKSFWEEIAKAQMNAQEQTVEGIMNEVDKDEVDVAEERLRRGIKMFIQEFDKVDSMTAQPATGGGGEADGGDQQF